MTTIPKETQPISEPVPKEEHYAKLDAQYSAVESAFNVVARVLAIRFFLFLTLIGSFVLSIIATNNQSPLSVWIIGVFAAVTTLPMTIIEFRGKRGG